MKPPPPPIDAALVCELIAGQFPQWGSLPIRAVEPGGWDNRTFRLGETMLVRLPSSAAYALQVEKEQFWLPRLAAGLPLPIPTPLAIGKPVESYPWPWSVYDWLEDEPASADNVNDMAQFAEDLAGFLSALRLVDASGGPAPGSHNFQRGGPPSTYDGEVRSAIAALAGRIDAPHATEIWDRALQSTWDKLPVWFHGDIAPGNLLVRDGRLAAVIDFGMSGVGDPACDLAAAWTIFEGRSRAVFHQRMDLDGETWVRGRGWALWKALITAGGKDPNNTKAAAALRVIEALMLDDPKHPC